MSGGCVGGAICMLCWTPYALIGTLAFQCGGGVRGGVCGLDDMTVGQRAEAAAIVLERLARLQCRDGCDAGLNAAADGPRAQVKGA